MNPPVSVEITRADGEVLVRPAQTVVAALGFVAEGEISAKGWADRVVVHDPANPDPSQAFALSRLDTLDMAHVPMGIFRDVERPTYDDAVREQVDGAVATAGGPARTGTT